MAGGPIGRRSAYLRGKLSGGGKGRGKPPHNRGGPLGPADARGCIPRVRGRTGSSPAHPFGSLATIGAWWNKGVPPKAHSFASPSFERFCPFEDERRFGSRQDAEACPRPRHQN